MSNLIPRNSETKAHLCAYRLFLEKIRASKIASNPLLPSPLRLKSSPSIGSPGDQSTTRCSRDRISMMIGDVDDLPGECQRTMRLLELLQRTHYELVQVTHGQQTSNFLKTHPFIRDIIFDNDFSSFIYLRYICERFFPVWIIVCSKK